MIFLLLSVGFIYSWPFVSAAGSRFRQKHSDKVPANCQTFAIRQLVESQADILKNKSSVGLQRRLWFHCDKPAFAPPELICWFISSNEIMEIIERSCRARCTLSEPGTFCRTLYFEMHHPEQDLSFSGPTSICQKSWTGFKSDMNKSQTAFWCFCLSNLQISTKESPALKAADISVLTQDRSVLVMEGRLRCSDMTAYFYLD